MDETPECARVRPLLAELATGAATGEERARALRHAASCRACGRELAELARVADALLLLTPEREPPTGFETTVIRHIGALTHRQSRVLARLRHPQLRLPQVLRPRFRLPSRRAAAWLVAVLVAVVLGATGGGSVVYWRGAADRAVADQYRQAQATATGRYPKAAEVTSSAGAVVGRVYLYQGMPSWVMVALFAAPAPGQYAMTVHTADGRSYWAGTCVVTGQSATVGYPLPVSANQVVAIDITRPGVRLSVHPNR